ncbi:Ig-like domain-containing protein [Prevotellamassilia timonensis]|uniref:Ig-like domain-containing protein n=1 Tax=Prevotellamassilia timonensis TaxID=1852370 RepID=UPI003079FCCD
MKRFLLLLMCVLNSIWASAQFSGSGNGTESDPYLIYSATQLYQMNNFLNQPGVVFKLMTDIDLSDFIAENFNDEGWTPIGNSSSNSFQGKFLGNNHKITSLTINKPNKDYVGLWGYVNGATISDLKLECQNISGRSYVGCLVGRSEESTISGISVTNTEIHASSFYLGGIIGVAIKTSLNNSSYVGKVIGAERVGGVVGHFFDGTISNIKSAANIEATCVVGGLIGIGREFTGTNCKVIGNIQGVETIGGCIGFISSIDNESKSTPSSSLRSFSHKGEIVNSGDYTGGVVGSLNANVSISDCTHWGNIEGKSYVGGIVGSYGPSINEDRPTYQISTSESKIKDSRTISSDIADSRYADLFPIIEGCTVIGDIKGLIGVGGLIGTTIDGCRYIFNQANGDYNNTGRRYYLFRNGSLVNSYSAYNFSPTDILEIVGVNLSISDCSYSGKLQGTYNVGGISGYQREGSINRCISNSASIKGTGCTGGIIGKNENVTVQNSFALSRTISASALDSLGRISGSANANNGNNMALVTTKVFSNGVLQSIRDDNAKQGQSIGASILKLKATYVAKGWDMEKVWNILETESYPYMAYQTAPPVVASKLVSGATTITGSSLKGGKVYMIYKDQAPVETICNGNTWSFTTEPLQAGATIQFYAETDDLVPSYLTIATVDYKGSGTEADPYLVYTAEDLQGAYKKGYFKLMNDIDLTSWIKENSPTKGWLPIGQNTGDASNFNGDGHKITGLWTNTTDDNVGLFSNFSSGTIKNLTVEVAKGKKVKGGNYTGIIIGRNMNGTLLNCTAKGDVEGTLNVGGVIGGSEKNTLNNLTFEGNVTSATNNAHVGGAIGFDKASTITSVHAYSTLNAAGEQTKVGGVVGNIEESTLTKSHAQCNIHVTGANAMVGGVAGYSAAQIALSYSTGEVSAEGADSYVGGVVGYAKDAINNCYSAAKLTGTLYTGGICAYSFSTINNCYARGDISGVRYGGGLVAQLDGASATITNSVAANNVLSLSDQSSWGSRAVGGFKNGAAEPDNTNYALNTMQVSLNNVPQKKTDNAVEGIAKTIEVLQQAQSYMDLGWNFEKDWGIDEGQMFPYLLWEVDVNPVTEITFDKSSLIVAQGKTATIAATVMPMGATNKRLDWKSDNEEVATVENGEVTAVGIGKAHITATATDGSKVEASCEVTVVANRDEAIAQLQTLVDNAKQLYDNSVEGENIGEYQKGARAELIAAINKVRTQISSTMDDEAIASCTETINNAVTLFKSKCVTAGEDTDISLYPDVIYLEPVEAAAGSQVTLSLKMNNTVPMTGFQCDIYFPEKTHVAKDEDGFNKIELSLARTTAKKTDYFNSAKQKTGAMRILCSSTRSYTFSGNEGEVATIVLDVDKDIEEGEYPIIMKTIVLSDANAKAYEVDYLKTTLKISSYTLGDVNNDGKINVSDFSAMANYLMGNPGEVFIEKAGDLNADGIVNVADMTALANLILFGDIMKPESAMQTRSKKVSLPEVTAHVEKTDAENEYQLTLALDNKGMKYSGFQFDMLLPEGVQVKKDAFNNNEVRLSDSRQAANALFMSNMIADHTFRVLGASATGNIYSGTTGDFIKLLLVAEEGMNADNAVVTINNMVLAKDGRGVCPQAVTANLPIGETTSISNIEQGKFVNVYDLKGFCLKSHVTIQQALKNLPKGVYIINGKKVVK